jgi:hypothetical protein
MPNNVNIQSSYKCVKENKIGIRELSYEGVNWSGLVESSKGGHFRFNKRRYILKLIEKQGNPYTLILVQFPGYVCVKSTSWKNSNERPLQERNCLCFM